MKYTDSQKRAIESRGGDLLVAAGAGSGKTTVLAERIMGRIKEGASIKDFLIVTFTNSAAADLKAKLADKLSSLCAEHPDEPRLQKELYSLPAADIGTIDSFCLEYVKQSAAVLGLGGVSVGDESLCAALKAESAEAVLTDMCERDDPAADLLLDNFASHKSDQGLLNAAVMLYDKIRAYPFYLDWFEEKVADYKAEAKRFADGEELFDLPRGALVKARVAETLEACLGAVADMTALAEDEKQSAFAAKVEAEVASVAEGFDKGYAAFCGRIAVFPRLVRPKKCGDAFVAAYTKAKDMVNKELKTYMRTAEELEREYTLTAAVLEALLAFIRLLDKEYGTRKASRGIIDFADGEQCFLRLLVEKTPQGYLKKGLCRQLSEAYTEVYVDEYQDVSPLQDTIFALIATGKRFMVGDVKQSIYGFRNAYPELFMGYKDGFDDEGTGIGKRVLLKENFRCDRGIIDFCNFVFGKIYTKKQADSDYKGEELVFGKGGDGAAPVSLRIYENAKDSPAEAEDTAQEIVRLISSGVKPSDIAILCRKKDTLQVYGDALAQRGVPISLNSGKAELLKQPEVLLAISILRVTDNPTDDISLAAAMRSPAFRFTAAELVEIRRGGVSFYDDVCRYAKGQACTSHRYKAVAASLKGRGLGTRHLAARRSKDALSQKCAAFLNKISLYRTKALVLSAHKLLWFIYEDCGFMTFPPKGREKVYRDNLFAFYRLAMGIESNGYKGLGVFTDYLRRLEQRDSSPAAEGDKGTDGVRLMTIHGSKGLEFPVVFVCDLGGKMKKTDSKSSLAVDYGRGVSLRLKSQKEAWRVSTLLRDAELREESHRSVAEEIRILYVAFTRARERLYLSLSLKEGLGAALEKDGLDTYGDLFLSAVAKGKEMFYNVEVKDASEWQVRFTRLSRGLDEDETVVLPDLAPPPPPQRPVAAKFTASTLRVGEGGLLTEEVGGNTVDKEPEFLAATGATGAMRGTANHLFMQFADFRKAEVDAAAEADRLLKLAFITPEQRSLIDLRAVGRFFTSPLYGQIKASGAVHREKRFTTEVPAALFEGAEGERVLLQGVIDCFFENPDGSFTLVDYKTDAVGADGEEALRKKHSIQLYLYRLYIEKLTGKSVSKAYIYSFALSKAVDCGRGYEIKEDNVL